MHRCRGRKYFYPQIVLTRVDKLEDNISKQIKKGLIRAEDRLIKLKEMQDTRIENVAHKLGVPRTSVHFIENYHKKHTQVDITINYYVLKLLDECLKESNKFIKLNLPKKETCAVF